MTFRCTEAGFALHWALLVTAQVGNFLPSSIPPMGGKPNPPPIEGSWRGEKALWLSYKSAPVAQVLQLAAHIDGGAGSQQLEQAADDDTHRELVGDNNTCVRSAARHVILVQAGKISDVKSQNGTAPTKRHALNAVRREPG